MKTINKINIALVSCTALLVGLMVFGVSLKIEVKPETASASTVTMMWINGTHGSNPQVAPGTTVTVTWQAPAGYSYCNTGVSPTLPLPAVWGGNQPYGIDKPTSGSYTVVANQSMRFQLQCAVNAPGPMVIEDGVAVDVVTTNQCTDMYQYTTTLGSTAHWDANGNFSGSAVSCPNAGTGWTLADSECLISGGPCYSQVCLWKKPTTQNLSYVLTHQGTDYYRPAINCANNPPSGYTLKSKGCAASGANGCISDVCLWQKTNTSTTTKNTLLLSHAGGNLTDNVNCRNSSPGSGYVFNSRIPILSYTTNVYSDLCLWQKSQTCAPTPACSQNSDCPAGSFTGSLTCQNNDVYQNYRTYTCQNPGTQSASCVPSDTLKLKQMCAAAQACDTGGCYPEAW